MVAQNELSDVKRVIGVVSGKGGVGKSLVTSLLAVDALREGKRVAVLDGCHSHMSLRFYAAFLTPPIVVPGAWGGEGRFERQAEY